MFFQLFYKFKTNSLRASLMLMRAAIISQLGLACRWQKRDKRPLTRRRLPARRSRSLAIKLRTGRGQTEWGESGSQPASERVRGPFISASLSRPLFPASGSGNPASGAGSGTLHGSNHRRRRGRVKAQKIQGNLGRWSLSRFVVIPCHPIDPRSFELTFQPHSDKTLWTRTKRVSPKLEK